MIGVRNSRTLKMMQLTMLLAMSIILHFIDQSIQLPVAVPGIKLGLANIMGIMALYMFGYKEMIVINVLRVLLSGLLRGTIFSIGFWISLGGVVLSTVAVMLVYHLFKSSMILLSVISSIAHCIGQLLVVAYFYQTINMFWNLPLMLVFGVPTGVLTGFVAQEAYQRIRRST